MFFNLRQDVFVLTLVSLSSLRPSLPQELMSDFNVSTGPHSSVEVTSAVLQALGHMGMAALLKDVSTGRYEWASDAAARLLAFEGEVLGQTDAELFDGVQAVSLRAADQQALSLPGGFLTEHRIERGGERHEYSAWRQ